MLRAASALATLAFTSPTVAELDQLAVGFWADRQVHSGPVAYSLLDARDPTRPFGSAAPGAIALDPQLVTGAERETRTRARDPWMRELLCTVIVHERGHANGLPHTDGGVMDRRVAATPWACARWAPLRRRSP
jgi:hypothetical protein